ncbi:MAG TPA: hypothetical protein VMU95_37685, partial [Trebonia sp.]|nr:hypothetical protein [Trebonia sp.]
MRRFGKHARQVSRPKWLAAGAVSACLLGLSTVALTNASAGTTTPPVSTPASVAPDSLSTSALSPAAAKALDVPTGTTGCPVPTSLLQMQCQILVEHTKKPAGAPSLAPRSAAVKASTISVENALGPAALQTAYG